MLSVGSAAGAAALGMVVASPVMVVAGLSVLVAHEYGHFFAAQASGAAARLPLFFGVGFIALGVTAVRGLVAPWRRAVALAGPMAGLYVCAFIAIAGVVTGLPVLMIAGGAGATWECFALTLGSDGRRFRAKETHGS